MSQLIEECIVDQLEPPPCRFISLGAESEVAERKLNTFTHYLYHFGLYAAVAAMFFLARHHQLSLSLFLPSPSPPSPTWAFFFSFFFRLLISSNLPHGDWARAPASAHFERCCRPKNARSKHMRAVFIINQLYGPLMEVISVKFMLRDLAVLSKTAVR